MSDTRRLKYWAASRLRGSVLPFWGTPRGRKVRFLEAHPDAPDLKFDAFAFLELPDGSGWWSGAGDVYVHRTLLEAIRLVLTAIRTERAEVLEEFRLLEDELARWEGRRPGGENHDVRVGQTVKGEMSQK